MNEEEFWEVVGEAEDMRLDIEGLEQGIIALSSSRAATEYLLSSLCDLVGEVAVARYRVSQTPEFETVYHCDDLEVLKAYYERRKPLAAKS